MNKKIKNILIFVGIGLILVLGYLFFVKKEVPQESLTSSINFLEEERVNTVNNFNVSTKTSEEILRALSDVRRLVLDTKIFSADEFRSLRDGTIILLHEGNEGRINPFAPVGSDFNINNITEGQEVPSI